MIVALLLISWAAMFVVGFLANWLPRHSEEYETARDIDDIMRDARDEVDRLATEYYRKGRW